MDENTKLKTMEIRLTELQKNKLIEYRNRIIALRSELEIVNKSMNDITDVILDTNEVKREDVSNISFYEDFITYDVIVEDDEDAK